MSTPARIEPPAVVPQLDLFGDLAAIESLDDAKFRALCSETLREVRRRDAEVSAVVGRMLALCARRWSKDDYQVFLADACKIAQREATTLWRWRRAAEEKMGLPPVAPGRGPRAGIAAARFQGPAISPNSTPPIEAKIATGADPSGPTPTSGDSGVGTAAPAPVAADVDGVRQADRFGEVPAGPTSTPSTPSGDEAAARAATVTDRRSGGHGAQREAATGAGPVETPARPVPISAGLAPSSTSGGEGEPAPSVNGARPAAPKASPASQPLDGRPTMGALDAALVLIARCSVGMVRGANQTAFACALNRLLEAKGLPLHRAEVEPMPKAGAR